MVGSYISRLCLCQYVPGNAAIASVLEGIERAFQFIVLKKFQRHMRGFKAKSLDN